MGYSVTSARRIAVSVLAGVPAGVLNSILLGGHDRQVFSGSLMVSVAVTEVVAVLIGGFRLARARSVAFLPLLFLFLSLFVGGGSSLFDGTVVNGVVVLAGIAIILRVYRRLVRRNGQSDSRGRTALGDVLMKAAAGLVPEPERAVRREEWGGHLDELTTAAMAGRFNVIHFGLQLILAGVRIRAAAWSSALIGGGR
jgi:hypothetical protein